jgi:serine protease
MRLSWLRLQWLYAVLMLALVPAQAGAVSLPQGGGAAPAPQPAAAPAARFIVKLRATQDYPAHEAAPARIAALAARHGLALQEARHIVSGIHLMRVALPAGGETVAQTLARLSADPEVEYAEVDERRHALSTPDDPLFGEQWYLQDAQPAAIDAVDAWSVTAGVPGLVIADLDTGVRFDHPDLRSASANRLLPGYNLISEPAVANNSYGRGPDASDPGDWISASDLKNPAFANCTIANSSWHGTRVAGILGAITNNQTGIAGVTWDGWVEPVRVLGKCGGYDSDIIAGMAWAVGMPVEGVPDNPYPARIVNMSLGSVGSCPADYQQMMQELVNAGVLVVVSAGNEGGPVDAPANCTGATGIAGLREVGTKVGYSSLGPQIALSAPAGNCVNTAAGQPCLFSIVTTSNSGTTVPETNTYTDESNYNVGTSFSAPQVAGIAGLMLSVNGNLTPGQLLARLQAGTQPFPVSTTAGVPLCHVPASSADLQTSECSCTTSTCGAGMANANGALLQALRPIAAIAPPSAVRAGSTVMLDGSGSAAACNATIVSFAWTVVQPAVNPPAILNANGARASVVAPTGSNTYTLMLTVTDDQGRADSEPVTLSSATVTTPAPAQAGDTACLAAVSYTVSASTSAGASAGSGSGSGSGGGGGGTMDAWTLLALAAATLSLLSTRRYSSRCAASSHGRCARR